MMRARTCSGVAIAWASCCCDGGSTTVVGIGRRPTAGGSTAQPAERVVVDDYLLAIDHLEARLMELDARLAGISETEPYRAQVLPRHRYVDRHADLGGIA
jgi:hypothetical protein